MLPRNGKKNVLLLSKKSSTSIKKGYLMTQQVLAQIEKALLEITELARAGYQAAGSIETQLKWCKSLFRWSTHNKAPWPIFYGGSLPLENLTCTEMIQN